MSVMLNSFYAMKVVPLKDIGSNVHHDTIHSKMLALLNMASFVDKHVLACDFFSLINLQTP